MFAEYRVMSVSAMPGFGLLAVMQLSSIPGWRWAVALSVVVFIVLLTRWIVERWAIGRARRLSAHHGVRRWVLHTATSPYDAIAGALDESGLIEVLQAELGPSRRLRWGFDPYALRFSAFLLAGIVALVIIFSGVPVGLITPSLAPAVIVLYDRFGGDRLLPFRVRDMVLTPVERRFVGWTGARTFDPASSTLSLILPLRGRYVYVVCHDGRRAAARVVSIPRLLEILTER
jgi:hypothetical protein